MAPSSIGEQIRRTSLGRSDDVRCLRTERQGAESGASGPGGGRELRGPLQICWSVVNTPRCQSSPKGRSVSRMEGGRSLDGTQGGAPAAGASCPAHSLPGIALLESRPDNCEKLHLCTPVLGHGGHHALNVSRRHLAAVPAAQPAPCHRILLQLVSLRGAPHAHAPHCQQRICPPQTEASSGWGAIAVLT